MYWCNIPSVDDSKGKVTIRPNVTQHDDEIPWKRFHIASVPCKHYNDVIMGAMAYQITSLTIVYSTVYSGEDPRKHQISASRAFVRGLHRDWWIPRTKGQ